MQLVGISLHVSYNVGTQDALGKCTGLQSGLQNGWKMFWNVDVLCSEGTDFSDGELMAVAVRGSGNVY